MKRSKPTVKVVRDNRRNKNDNSIPLKLRITFQRKYKYYSTGISLTDEDWKQLLNPDIKGKLRTARNEIAEIENAALRKIGNLSDFSFEKFEKSFFDNHYVPDSLEALYTEQIEKLKKNAQIGTASNYQCAINSLLNFKTNLTTKDITVDFLNAYEKWMLQNNKSRTTISMYVRTLRTIINVAKSNGIIPSEVYPFGNRKYVVPAGSNIKKALNKKDIQKIFEYPTEYGSNVDRAKDFWIFSYLCNGINMMDIAHLQWKDLNKTTIVFERKKTINTNRTNSKKIVAIRNQNIDNVIRKWSLSDKNKDGFIFDIIEKHDSAERVKAKVLQFTKVINKWMKRIGRELNFDITLTTYVARHSFATALVHAGTPMNVTKELLGHSNVLTTENYIATLPIEAIKGYTKDLDKFE